MKRIILVALFNILSLSVAAKTSSDQALMQKARSEFGKSQLEKAVSTYSRISKGSEFWLEALEEQSQAYGRLGQYDKAIANLKTVLAPQFTGLIGPEPYFVMALTELKICDYTGTLKTLTQFKKDMKSRILSLESINRDNNEIKVIFDRARAAKKLSFDQLGHLAVKMPRNLHRDRIADITSQKSLSKFQSRVIALAKSELKEINTMISKMQIIESEVIQKVNLLAHSDDRKKIGKFAKSKDELVFPGDEEVWFDELGQFKAQVEKCPTLKQRASL